MKTSNSWSSSATTMCGPVGKRGAGDMAARRGADSAGQQRTNRRDYETPGFETTRGFDHFVFLETERAARDTAEGVFVVDEQNAVGHAALSGGGEFISPPFNLSRDTRDSDQPQRTDVPLAGVG